MTSDSLLNGQAEGLVQSPRVKLVKSDRAMPFPDYRMLGLVGQGQFAQVYCAIHKRTGQLAAIKQVRHVSAQPSQEPLVLNELCHPNIVCAQAIAQTQTGYQFVLDYCEAGTLRSQMDFIVTPTAQSTAQPLLCSIAVDILKGLSYVHAQQVIHGDLKPENILLTYQSQPSENKRSRLMARISDFGSARFVAMPNQSRKEIGSPTYAAPERFDGQSSYASDLYSVGVILYELLLGDRPFSGSPERLRQAHQTQPVPFPKSLPFTVQQFLARSLHKQPNQRFSSVDEMLRAFQSLSWTDVIEASPERAIAATNCSSFVYSTSAEQIKPEVGAFSKSTNKQLHGKIHQLLPVPQGCFIVTDSAVYRLNSQGEYGSVIQLSQPSWIAISPDGRWLVTLPKSGQQPAQSIGQLITFRDSIELEIGYRRPVVFGEQLLKPVQNRIVQMLAIDRRYLIRVLASPNPAKSRLECCTRTGKLIGELPINLSFSSVALSSDPGEIVALSAPSSSDTAKLLLISLRPFQVHSVVLFATELCSRPRGIGVFPWGYAVIDKGGCLFLDRSAQSVGRLNLSGVSAIAPLPNGKALVAVSISPTAQSKNNSLEDITSSESSLLVVDLRSLNLDLVF